MVLRQSILTSACLPQSLIKKAILKPNRELDQEAIQNFKSKSAPHASVLVGVVVAVRLLR